MSETHADANSTADLRTKRSVLIQKYEWALPVLLFVFFVAITAPGIAHIWNPDELAHRVGNALEGRWQFDQTNFDYPSLPKYVMFGVGKLLQATRVTRIDFPTAARFVTVLLGGLIVSLTYLLTRKLGGGIGAAIIAALLTLSSSEFAVNARFAHNDLYLILFLLLTVYALVRYRQTAARLWLYAAFLFVGMAVSSKYNGISMIALPVLVFWLENRQRMRRKLLPMLETLFIGAVLVFLGYAIGTPKALTWMAFYFKRAAPAILHHAAYGRTPDSALGALGQWAVMWQSFSAPVFLLFMTALGYWLWRSLQRNAPQQKTLGVILLAIFLFDLPIMISYNYQARFFLAFIPLLSILSGLAVGAWSDQLAARFGRRASRLLVAGVALLLIYALLRVTSVALLIKNDARIPAGEFIANLPAETSLEYTYYPPVIPSEHFEREHNYPIIFVKFIGQEIEPPPRGKPYKAYNTGEKGLARRDTDYLVIDSFTYARFADDYICGINPIECDFFARLLAGETDYQLIGNFHYSLPPYLPQVKVNFVNPSIQVFARER